MLHSSLTEGDNIGNLDNYWTRIITWNILVNIFYSIVCKQYSITIATYHLACFVLPSCHSVRLFVCPVLSERCIERAVYCLPDSVWTQHYWYHHIDVGMHSQTSRQDHKGNAGYCKPLLKWIQSLLANNKNYSILSLLGTRPLWESIQSVLPPVLNLHHPLLR